VAVGVVPPVLELLVMAVLGVAVRAEEWAALALIVELSIRVVVEAALSLLETLVLVVQVLSLLKFQTLIAQPFLAA
jgi:hypothetical protein